MTFKLEEFRGYLAIDKTSLDEEVMRQPSLFYEVSEAFAEAAAERDYLKEQLGVVDASLDAEVRRASEKATEAHIKGQIQVHPRHKKAFDRWLDAKELADKLGSLKDAFKERSYMLRELGNLYVANYFGDAAVKPTYNTDIASYERRRERIAAAREEKT